MKQFVYHPVFKNKVLLSEIENKHLFIEDRLYKPEKWEKFYLDKEDEVNRTYGLEIELNLCHNVEVDPEKRYEVARDLLAVLNKDGAHFHIMRDNSVRNGIELVSAPMTYNYIKAKFDPKEINEIFSKNQLFATIDTGLHIHVGINHTRRVRELYVQLLAISYPLWIYVADRKYSRLEDRYVSLNYFVEREDLFKRYQSTLKSLITKNISLVNYYGVSYYDYPVYDRYTGLNFVNEKTIEFRMFSGSNDFNEIMNYLTFLNNFTLLADEISDSRVNDVYNLETFIERSNNDKLFIEMINYIKLVNNLKTRNFLYKNKFMFLDTYWYKTPSFKVSKKALAIKSDIYKQYLQLRKKISKTNINHKCSENINLLKDIELLLINEILEVVKVDENYFYLMSTKNNTDCIKIKKDNKKYVYLTGVSEKLLIKEDKRRLNLKSSFYIYCLKYLISLSLI